MKSILKELSSNTSAKYRLWMLMAVYTFSFLDRQIISILAQDIKLDLELTDSELGMLTGLAFAIFYATLGIPIARLADKFNRISIIAICLSIWSAMTVVSGMASNFLQLALARMGVGIGEAGALPCSHSIIADTFPPEKRSSAMSIFQLGVPAGILFGFLIGGWVNQWVGWRWALVLVGAPGILLAILLYYTVKEPQRDYFTSNQSQQKTSIGVITQISELLSNRTYVYIGIAATLASMGAYCIMAWVPSLLIREYQLSTGILGTLLSIIIGVGGGLGTYYAGIIGDRSASKKANGPLLLCMWINLLTAPLFFLGFIVADLTLSLAFLAPAYIIYLAWMGPNWAMVQAVSPSRTRAMASALILLMINLIGLGLGPLLVGIISDTLKEIGTERHLNWALISSLSVYPLAALFYGLAAKEYGKKVSCSNDTLETK